jgi:hypothetical protein
MFQRGISTSAVEDVGLRPSVVVEAYPNDLPFPSRLLLGWPQGEALHVHVAADNASDTLIVVTAYRPDPARWESDFTRRKP